MMKATCRPESARRFHPGLRPKCWPRCGGPEHPAGFPACRSRQQASHGAAPCASREATPHASPSLGRAERQGRCADGPASPETSHRPREPDAGALSPQVARASLHRSTGSLYPVSRADSRRRREASSQQRVRHRQDCVESVVALSRRWWRAWMPLSRVSRSTRSLLAEKPRTRSSCTTRALQQASSSSTWKGQHLAVGQSLATRRSAALVCATAADADFEHTTHFNQGERFPLFGNPGVLHTTVGLLPPS